MTSGPDPGELPGFWGSMVFRHAPIPRKGSGNQQQQQQQEQLTEYILSSQGCCIDSSEMHADTVKKFPSNWETTKKLEKTGVEAL